MPYGYAGQVLHVDLTHGTITVENPPEDLYRAYFGGSALGAHYVLKGVRPGTDPFAPENVLALAVGVTTGVAIPGLSRMTAVAKSPLTGGIGDSQCGGFWPAELKFSGFDAVVIRGASPVPVFLWIHDGQAELRDAAHLWGMETLDVETRIKRELADPRVEVLQSGPAGERLVRFASLVNMSSRHNGRTGMGGVMGSKNLKAVAVRGHARPTSADPARVRELAKRIFGRDPHSEFLQFGSSGGLTAQQAAGGLPSYNWRSGVIDGADDLSGATMYNTILRGAKDGLQNRLGRDTCFACTVRCKRVVEEADEPYRLTPGYGGPEYETLGTLGTYCGVTDLAAVAHANERCNAHGMDSISCGATIAWAMDCFENGLISEADTGLDLRFGNAPALVKMVDMIGRREGFGDVLAEGSVRAAAAIGKGRELLAAVKGLEVPAHSPHLKRSLGLVYAVNPFGADHGSCEHDAAYEGAEAYEPYRDRLEPMGLTQPQEPYSLGPEKVRYALTTQYLYSLMDSAALCQFVFGSFWQLSGPTEIAEIVSAVTGWDVTVDELLTVGARRLNMLRAFNAREGIGRSDDRLPDRFFDRPLEGGPTDGWKLDRAVYDLALDEYYRQAGWDVETGHPTLQRLRDLGIEWAATPGEGGASGS